MEPLARRGLQFLLGGLSGKSKKQKQNNLLLSTKQEVRGAVLSLFSKWSLIFHNSVGHLCLCASLRMQRTPQAHIQSNSQLRVKLRGRVTLSGVCLQHAGYYTWWILIATQAPVRPRGQWSPSLPAAAPISPPLPSHLFSVWTDITHPISSSAPLSSLRLLTLINYVLHPYTNLVSVIARLPNIQMIFPAGPRSGVMWPRCLGPLRQWRPAPS